MTDNNPFANWPNMDKPKAPQTGPEYRALPGSGYEENRAMSRNNALEDFLGGSPFSVFVKLVFVSLVVGALLLWLDLRPADIFRGIRNFIDRIYELGFGAVREVIDYIVAGAVIVVPAWFLLRLLNASGKR